MQFQVPQFIEVEDKIFGPLTFKQFVYLAGGAGLAYMIWRLLPSFIALPFALMLVGAGAALAFMTYNGQPFILAIEHAFFYTIRGKLYLWSNEQATIAARKKVEETQVQKQTSAAPYVPKLSESRLHDLSWSLDINERIAAGTATEDDRVQRAPRNPVPNMRTARDALIQ